MEKSFGTVSQTIEGLKQEGYTVDFNIEQECLTCHKRNTVLSSEDFEIDAVYRFEGESNPDDEAIVYAISSPKYKVKGVLVNAYGLYADEASNALIQKLHQKQQQAIKIAVKDQPLKRNRHLLQLSKDHHFSLLFSWKIRQGLKNGVEFNRIKKYVEYFWNQHLHSHFREEEVIVFAVLQDEAVKKALEEHRKIEQKVKAVLESSKEAEALEQLSWLADEVDGHVRYEERELFPHIEKSLTETQLEQIGAQLRNAPVLKDEYPDAFWTEKKEL